MRDWNGSKVAVLAGGISSEREISLKSGRAVHRALLEAGCHAFLVDPAVPDFLMPLKREEAAVVFLALHGRFGEDGQLQSILDEAHIPYTGSRVEGCRNAFDKEIARACFHRARLKVPKGFVIHTPEAVPLPFRRPFFVKPCRGGSSIGLSLVRKEEDYDEALRKAFAEDSKVLIEEAVTGREITVGILGERCLPLLEIRTPRSFFDYEAKYEDPQTRYLEPQDLSPGEMEAISQAALEAHRSLGCQGFSRADLIWAQGEPVILEVNAIPGLTEKSLLPKMARFAGISFKDLCLQILEQAMPGVIPVERCSFEKNKNL